MTTTARGLHRAGIRSVFTSALVVFILVACGSPRIEPPANSPVPADGIVLDGVVEPGVEAGCLILRPTSGTTTYLLLGGDQDVLVPGRTVTGRGKLRPDLATMCQQGVPLEVLTATG